jgi:dye decolorizing peroxidase
VEADEVSGRLTRRRFVAAAAGVGVGVGGGAYGLLDWLRSSSGRALPPRQHAWDAVLTHDQYGNAVAPRHARLLLLDVRGRPSPESARTLEDALRSLERLYPWGPEGLLFLVGWGPRYFERSLGVRSPVPRPEPLSSFELPALDDYDVCIHLACDDQQRIDGVTGALVHGRKLAARNGPLDLRPVLALREIRTGFVGARLPAAHQDVSGIPGGRPVPVAAPLYMGFKSGFTKNQASEDDVTIAAGPFAGGTTMHVSRMRLRLDSWYQLLDERDRVARMFAPQVSPDQVSRFTTDAPSEPGRIDQAASRYGVVGHAQASAVARRKGRPLILRRDFDTVDGGEAGLHFVALQRSIDDFVTTRKAMNAPRASYLNPAITETVNNGINEFIFVTNRANYVVPPRTRRSFPLLRA